MQIPAAFAAVVIIWSSTQLAIQLKNMAASRATLLTLITPVLALLLGHALNNERVGIEVWFGTGMILAGLMSHEWGDILLKRFAQRSKTSDED